MSCWGSKKTSEFLKTLWLVRCRPGYLHFHLSYHGSHCFLLEFSVTRITWRIFSRENRFSNSWLFFCYCWGDQLVFMACLCLLLSSFIFLMLKCVREKEQVCVNCVCSHGSVCIWEREEGGGWCHLSQANDWDCWGCSFQSRLVMMKTSMECNAST